MAAPFVLPLADCTERSLVGGKAEGLALLIRHGFHVPRGLCLTTTAYAAMLRAADIDAGLVWADAKAAHGEARLRLLSRVSAKISTTGMPAAVESELRFALASLWDVPHGLWAVRSSATNEDGRTRSMAGHYHTVLGVARESLARTVVDQWAALWSGPAASLLEFGPHGRHPELAIVLQPMVDARAAGVMFSCHPVTRQLDRIVINAVVGLGAPLVAGEATPDEFVIVMQEKAGGAAIVSRRLAPKPTMRRLGPAGVSEEPVESDRAGEAALTDAQIVDLARLAKQVEGAVGYPADIEWAFDGEDIWLLQARPITTLGSTLTNETSQWSRANFKETLPELPSPAAVSFLQEYMEHNLLQHYRDLGCRIPPGLSPVKIVRGRPFINVTLFQLLVAQLGSDPEKVTEHMGGQGTVPTPLPERLPPLRLLRAGMIVWGKMQRALRQAPAWFQEMKQMANAPIGAAPAEDRLHALLEENEALGLRLRSQDPTFAIAAGVGQGSDIAGALLSRWFPTEWRALLNAALQGQGTVISAGQILWLADLADAARAEPAASDYFLAQSWDPRGYRAALAGTRFLAEWDRFLEAYGQRAIGESDIMVPRHAERPDSLLAVVRGHLRSGGSRSSHDTVAHQEATRTAALARIRRRVRWRPGGWPLFHWWYRRLCRFLSLREANRHHLMYFLVAVRRRLQEIGTILAREGRLAAPEDIFYLTVQEIRSVRREPATSWQILVADRRREAGENEALSVPDFLGPGESDTEEPVAGAADPDTLQGIPISPGFVTGPVCVARTSADFSGVRPGVILVLPVIDPGLTPYFGIAAGVVAEMGGTLSHGAIIAREYGIPVVANVGRATKVLRDGETVELDAFRGVVTRVPRSG